MPDPMPPIDYMGPQGGALAMAFGTGVVFASGVWSGTVALLWRLFGDKRIKALETDIVTLKADHERAMTAMAANHAATIAAERHRCDEEIDQLRTQITQMQTIQTVLIANGTAGQRQAVQAAISEARVTADADRTE